MAKLAIKGHRTRGGEVIQLLEMLGGNNVYNYDGSGGVSFSICEKNMISFDFIPADDYIVFTLEEFEEKYPYKVGDKVQHKGATSCGSVFEVEKMRWEVDTVMYTLRLFGCNYKSSTLPAEYLQLYKPTIEDANKAVFDCNAQCNNIRNEIIDKEQVYYDNEINCYHQDFGDKVRIRLGNDYEIKVEDKITYIVKKQPQYPKDYEGCCDVLKIPNDERYIDIDVPLDYNKLLSTFTKLIICRKAYWEIAGKQLGLLDKHWEPDWCDENKLKYCIECSFGTIDKTISIVNGCFLAFPTKKMRDAFLENFKGLIEQCKELL